jgi:hypothetical protein
MKQRSTFDVVRNASWESHGSVTFPGQGEVAGLNGTQLRAGYYPCFGVTFKATPLVTIPESTPTVYWWDAGDKKVKSLTHTPEAPRKLMLNVVHNPTCQEAAALRLTIEQFIANDPSGQSKDYTPHVRMDDAFVAAFSKVVFTEVAHDLLVSETLTLATVNVWERDGTPHKNPVEAGPFDIVFHMTHLEGTAFGDVMMTTATWSNGYVSFYGCCRL